MINFKRLLVLLFFAVMISCGKSQQSKQSSSQPQSDAGTEVAMTDSTSADSILNALDKSSQELKSIADEAQNAVDELLENN